MTVDRGGVRQRQVSIRFVERGSVAGDCRWCLSGVECELRNGFILRGIDGCGVRVIVRSVDLCES